MSRGESRQYWVAQLSEYWDSGFSILETCENDSDRNEESSGVRLKLFPGDGGYPVGKFIRGEFQSFRGILRQNNRIAECFVACLGDEQLA